MPCRDLSRFLEELAELRAKFPEHQRKKAGPIIFQWVKAVNFFLAG